MRYVYFSLNVSLHVVTIYYVLKKSIKDSDSDNIQCCYVW